MLQEHQADWLIQSWWMESSSWILSIFWFNHPSGWCHPKSNPYAARMFVCQLESRRYFLTSRVEFSSCPRKDINFCFTTFQKDFQSLSLQEDAQLHILLPKSVIEEREKQLLWFIRNNQGHKLGVKNRVAREICVSW